MHIATFTIIRYSGIHSVITVLLPRINFYVTSVRNGQSMKSLYKCHGNLKAERTFVLYP